MMSFIKDFFEDFIGISIREDNFTSYRRSTDDPLILSLRDYPRDEMEEPEVEYIPIPVEDSNINEVVNAEVLS